MVLRLVLISNVQNSEATACIQHAYCGFLDDFSNCSCIFCQKKTETRTIHYISQVSKCTCNYCLHKSNPANCTYPDSIAGEPFLFEKNLRVNYGNFLDSALRMAYLTKIAICDSKMLQPAKTGRDHFFRVHMVKFSF